MADDSVAEEWLDDRQGKSLRFGSADGSGTWKGAGVRRWLGPGAGAVLLLAGGLGWWAAPTDGAMVRTPTPAPAPAPEPQAGQDALPGGDIPEAARVSSRGRHLLSDEEREARRFGRQDRNRDGAVSRDEFLAARRKSFDRLDRNGDGQLSFEEYAAASAARFAAADRNADRQLSRSEFAATASQRSGGTGKSSAGKSSAGKSSAGASGG